MRAIPVNWKSLHHCTGESLSFPLNTGESHVTVHGYADGEFSIIVDFVNEEGELFPVCIAHGTSVHGTYQLDGASGITFKPVKKTTNLAADVRQTFMERKEIVDPVPKRLIIPGVSETFEQRILRGVSNLLDNRGLGGDNYRGFNYPQEPDDEGLSDHDPEFGAGYAVDPAIDSAMDMALRDRAASRKPKRVHTPDVSTGDDGQVDNVGLPAGKPAYSADLRAALDKYPSLASDLQALLDRANKAGPIPGE